MLNEFSNVFIFTEKSGSISNSHPLQYRVDIYFCRNNQIILCLRKCIFHVSILFNYTLFTLKPQPTLALTCHYSSHFNIHLISQFKINNFKKKSSSTTLIKLLDHIAPSV